MSSTTPRASNLKIMTKKTMTSALLPPRPFIDLPRSTFQALFLNPHHPDRLSRLNRLPPLHSSSPSSSSSSSSLPILNISLFIIFALIVLIHSALPLLNLRSE
mmetsp:Transcript_42083/g.70107  ORF Transcript_42083/g.70107 Transcript_42083/m.70107 type:complete len:103 (-) Transcript_42083:16-324(-)